MKFSQKWINEYITLKQSLPEIVHMLTMAGLEVDSVTPAAPTFKGVVVGRVNKVTKHPKADNLSICEVDIKTEQLTIVCGADVQETNMVALAKEGAYLSAFHQPGDTIQATALKGVTSHGMLCSEKELGLSDKSSGLFFLPQDAPIGDDLWHYLDLDDQVVEIDLTPNRGDCLCTVGVARELGVLTRTAVTITKPSAVAPTIDDTFQIEIEAKDHCPRYVGRVIKGIKQNADTPIWLQERLRRGGIRCIHPVVDVLNYVMLEMGQPMHGFDLSQLTGQIKVRLAQPMEPIKLLDESEVELANNTLVIADDNGPVAIAGVMGGAESAVQNQTQDVFLESALFNQVHQAGIARQYGLHTDSAFRFERGVDPDIQALAIERATDLILSICGGQPGPVSDVFVNPPKAKDITLRFPRIEKILGIHFEKQQVEDLLQSIGCEIKNSNSKNADEIHIIPPNYRYDISDEIDLIEELARVYGYEKVPSELPRTPLTLPSCKEDTITASRLKKAMVDMGYHEVNTYSFVDSTWQETLFPNDKLLKLLNPISQDMDTMRQSLLPGLLKTIAFNQRRQQHRVQVFETGNRFYYEAENLKQTPQIAGACFGLQKPESWRSDNQEADFFHIKSHIERLWQLTQKMPLTFKRTDYPLNQKGQSASIHEGDRQIGMMGKLNTEIERALDIEGPIYWFTCDLLPFQQKHIPILHKPSKFPEIRRDIAITINEDILAHELTNYVGQMANEWLVDTLIFDEYKGQGIEKSRKSIAIGLILQHPSRTLIDSEVNELMDSIVAGLHKEFGAELRD